MRFNHLFILVGLVTFLTACGSSQELEPTPSVSPTEVLVPILTSTQTLIPTLAPSVTPIPTGTFTPTPTETPSLTPTVTPLPGLVVLPLDTLEKGVPWLPLDEDARPGVNFVAFNFKLPPFNNVLVRQAFAHAIDRQVLAEMAERYKASNPKPATSLTPPITLGRNLYNEVGISFDPQKAKELLEKAGYSDPTMFPEATIIVNAYGDIAPGARFNMANAMVDMWRTYLEVSVKVEVVSTFNDYGNRLRTNPPEIFWLGWVADINDPDNFLREIFHSASQFNFGAFSNPKFDQLVDKAARITDPAERQVLYILAEKILCVDEAALVPLFHVTRK